MSATAIILLTLLSTVVGIIIGWVMRGDSNGPHYDD